MNWRQAQTELDHMGCTEAVPNKQEIQSAK